MDKHDGPDYPTPRDRVWRWRVQEFRDLGFTVHQRRVLADHGVSPHDAARLVLAPPAGRGCPIDTAFDILA